MATLVENRTYTLNLNQNEKDILTRFLKNATLDEEDDFDFKEMSTFENLYQLLREEN